MKVFLWMMFFLSIAPIVSASAKPETAKRAIGVISERSKADFDSQVQPLLKEELRRCSQCEVKNLTPYTPEGQFDATQVATVLTNLSPAEMPLLFVDWNTPFSASVAAVVESLKKIKSQGVFIVASAGFAKDGQDTVGLNKTLWGQLPDVIVLGEINQRERLLKQSFFGPEMLTALKPPKEYDEKGVAPFFFVGRLASVWDKKSAQEWQNYLREKKAKSRKLWPDLNDFF